MDNPQTMPEITDLAKGALTKRQWLIYYKNIWTRNAMAHTIDVQSDRVAKAKDKEEMVQADDGREVPVKQRLELRKMKLQDTLNLLASIDTLLAMSDEDLEKQHTPDALKVDEDMLAPSQGKPCTTENNENGRYEETAPGKFVCIPLGKSPEQYLKEQVEKGEQKPDEGADQEAKKE